MKAALLEILSVIHQEPAEGSLFMPCCDRMPSQLPHYHRLTGEADQVTCPGNDRTFF